MSGPLYGLGRRDAAEPEVIKAFEEGGASVQRLSAKDCPDLAVGYLGVTHLVEVKTNHKRLREGQKRWFEGWRGEAPVIARNAPQARQWLRTWSDKATSLSTCLKANAALDAIESQKKGGGNWQAAEDHEDDFADFVRERFGS